MKNVRTPLFDKLCYATLIIISVILLLNNIIFSNFNNNIKIKLNHYSFSFIGFFKYNIPNYYDILKDNYAVINDLKTENDNLKIKLAATAKDSIIIQQQEKTIANLSASVNGLNFNKINNIKATSIISNAVRYPDTSFIINIGSSQKLQANTLAISTIGIIGYVKDIYKNSAVIISIVNPNFKISAKTDNLGINLIVSGNNTINPDVAIYSKNNRLIENELVVTSGLEGYFPPNIPIGTLYKDEKNQWKLNLFEKFDKLEYVYLVK